MKYRYYLAYGSNLDRDQMEWRCPNAVPVGLAYLDGYRLMFKGSKTGSYLTIEKAEGMEVPVIVWKVSQHDEDSLDRYEGFPTFYYKKDIKDLRYFDFADESHGMIDAFVYIMHEERKLGRPSQEYMCTCLKGYDDFGLDCSYLYDAYRYTVKNK